MLFCTPPFAPVAARDAKSGGIPDLVRLTIKPDLIDLSAQDRRALAERLVDDALAALTRGKP
ncbi:MAG TPA: hypothetical protein VIA61_13420 [Methylomirabilota bacterium]